MDGERESFQVFENVLFVRLFRTFRVAIQPVKLAIAIGAIAVICLAGWVMDLSTPVVATDAGLTELDVYMTNPEGVSQFIEANRNTAERVGMFSTLWHFGSERYHAALYSLFSVDLPAVAANIGRYFRAVAWAVRYHYLYCAIFFLIELAVLSVAGGAICRMAALQFAKDEKPGLTESLRYGVRKFTSFFTAPLLPVGMIVFVGVFVFLLGLIANIPRAGELIMAIFMPLALLAGALIGVVLIGAVAGFNLMFPAVAYDGSDCFDAISRAFNYLYSRPWHMLFYSAVAASYGAVCYVFVRFFAFLLLLATYTLLDLGVFANGAGKLERIWAQPTFVRLVPPNLEPTANWSEWFAAHLVYLFLLVVVGLVVSFVVSFYFSANTAIYALMRKKVDNTAIDDVYTLTGEGEPEPAAEESKDEGPGPSAEDSDTESSESQTSEPQTEED